MHFASGGVLNNHVQEEQSVLNEGMNEQNVTHTNNDVLFSLKNEENVDTGYSMDKF